MASDDNVQEEMKHAGDKAAQALFQELSADNEEQAPTEIESLCMNCRQTVGYYLLT